MITSARRLLIVAAATVCAAALAQPTPEPVPIELEQRFLAQIDHLRSEQGLNAEGLIEPLRGLALLYQEAGEHALAVVALREARQILRVNRGLFSETVDEALLLRQQVRSEKALGNGEGAWNLQHDLIIIGRKHLDDMRMLPIFLELIDDRTQLVEEFSTTDFGDLRPGIYVPCENGARPTPINSGKRGAPVPVSDARNCPFGSYSMVVARLRGAVLRNYADAIAVLIRNGDYASQELRQLEKEALGLVPFERRGWFACSFRTFGEFLDSELDSCMDTASGSGVGGWASLMRLLFYEVRSGAPAARAKAFAELGDWYVWAEHLASSRKLSDADEIALTLYGRALAELRQGDGARESMAAIFSPELPVTLPTYAPNPLASMESSRFIDVAFAITRHGESGQIEILDSSENATGVEERALVRLVKYASFRPRAVDGELADSASVVLRYYLPEKPLIAP
jgi:hypothetical protein